MNTTTEAKLYDLKKDRDRLAPRVIPEALRDLDKEIARLEAEIAASAARDALLEQIAEGTKTRADLDAFDAQRRAQATDAEIARRREAIEARRQETVAAERRRDRTDAGPC